MAKEKTLEDLFLDTLKDIYYAEKRILKALPKMAKGAASPKLKKGFEKHLAQTEGQVERLEQVFEIIGQPARGKKCEAIEGILAEGEEIMKSYKGTPALDAGLISAAQAVEHYEITRYGTLRRWAETLGKRNAVTLLERTLREESETDELLSQIAEQANRSAEAGQPAGRAGSGRRGKSTAALSGAEGAANGR
ncbi:ferritin-like domain-containing protein [Aestuariivirga sp.]|uniref:YciE/YciF ferroxidase family protein n=1 Tax=Aestuariivirga sp. TaxID=2650926 RepID=UPI0035B2B89C